MLRRGVDVAPDAFGDQLDELLGYLAEDGTPRSPRPASIVAIPVNVPPPDIFVLSSSDHGAGVAAKRGLGFAFAHHMSPLDTVSQIARYRASFEPSKFRKEPYAIASMSVICAETDEAAGALASSGRLALVRMMQGQRDLPLASVEEARAYVFDDEELAVLAAFETHAVVGGPGHVRAKLRAFIRASDVDEIMVLTLVHDVEARRRSYSLVAEILAGLVL